MCTRFFSTDSQILQHIYVIILILVPEKRELFNLPLSQGAEDQYQNWNQAQ